MTENRGNFREIIVVGERNKGQIILFTKAFSSKVVCKDNVVKAVRIKCDIWIEFTCLEFIDMIIIEVILNTMIDWSEIAIVMGILSVKLHTIVVEVERIRTVYLNSFEIKGVDIIGVIIRLDLSGIQVVINVGGD